MGQKAKKDEIETILSWLRKQANEGIQSKTGCLIDTLQARALFDARQIAAELTSDLELVGMSEARSVLSEVSALLESDTVFSNCDRLTYLLLDLERMLGAMPQPPSEFCVLPAPMHLSEKNTPLTLQSPRAERG